MNNRVQQRTNENDIPTVENARWFDARTLRIAASACTLYLLEFTNDADIKKIIKHSSCEIKYFVETHRCKLCVILRSRVIRVVCPR